MRQWHLATPEDTKLDSRGLSQSTPCDPRASLKAREARSVADQTVKALFDREAASYCFA